jgi:proline dehydrogenase
MQDAADDLVTEMMRKYNKEKAIVFQYIANVSLIVGLLGKKLHEQAKRWILYWYEIVRGAYMEKKLFMPKKRIPITMRFKRSY